MVLQTNDTEVHKPARKEFCSLQEQLVLQKTLNSGGGLRECTDEENVMLLAHVFSEQKLHLQGCKGYKYTGTTVAFDGSEDWVIGRDAKTFWDEQNMRWRINLALRDIKKRHDDKTLIWNFENVQREIAPYPAHGRYDAEPEGMEDEYVPSAVAEESAVAEDEELWDRDSDRTESDFAAAPATDEEPDAFDPSD